MSVSIHDWLVEQVNDTLRRKRWNELCWKWTVQIMYQVVNFHTLIKLSLLDSTQLFLHLIWSHLSLFTSLRSRLEPLSHILDSFIHSFDLTHFFYSFHSYSFYIRIIFDVCVLYYMFATLCSTQLHSKCWLKSFNREQKFWTWAQAVVTCPLVLHS
jgi:hypothetical protein